MPIWDFLSAWTCKASEGRPQTGRFLPERVDDEGGYTISNLVLVVEEVNFVVAGVRKDELLKWSKAKADELFAQAEKAKATTSC